MDRNLEPSKCVGKGLVDLDFSFLANGSSDVLTSTLRGAGADWVESVAHSATGILLVTLTLGARARYVVSKHVELADLNASDDGAFATSGPVANEGSSTAKMTFKVYLRAVDGTKTDYSARRVSVRLVLKNSTVGV